MQKRKSDCYCITLRRAAQTISDLYDAHMAVIGITVNQYSLLSDLGHFPHCSVSELAEYAGLERTTVVRALKPLTAKGFVKDLADEGERKKDLCLTAEGEEIVKKEGQSGIRSRKRLKDALEKPACQSCRSY